LRARREPAGRFFSAFKTLVCGVGVLADLVELHRVAFMAFLMQWELGLLGGGCDGQETSGTDGVVGSVLIVTVVKVADASLVHEVPFRVPGWLVI
jgi:hypothetical protein